METFIGSVAIGSIKLAFAIAKHGARMVTTLDVVLLHPKLFIKVLKVIVDVPT